MPHIENPPTKPCPTCGGRGDVKPYSTFRAEREVCRRCDGAGTVVAYPLDHTTPELEAWIEAHRDPAWQPPAPPKAPRFPFGLKRIPARADGLMVGAYVTLRREIVGMRYDERMPADVAVWQIVCEGGTGRNRVLGLVADDGSQRTATAYADHLAPLSREAVA